MVIERQLQIVKSSTSPWADRQVNTNDVTGPRQSDDTTAVAVVDRLHTTYNYTSDIISVPNT